jgi:acyl-CoA hydrolase
LSPLAVYADGPDAPVVDPAALNALGGDPPDVVLGWTLRPLPWLGLLPRPATTFMAGYGLAAAIEAGHVVSVPTRISAVAPALAGRLRPDVAVVTGKPWRGGFRFVSGVGWAAAAARHASAVVVEVVEAPDVDSPPIPGRVVEVVERSASRDDPPVPRVGQPERRIGELVADLVPAGATLQWGPGSIGAAVVRAIDRPVQVLSGLVTDELAGLAERGMLVGQAEATYMWGGPALRELAGAGGLRLRGVEFTHDPGRLAALDRFVAVNTAVEVGLDGAVNVERAGGRLVAGPGGHADYCEAARRSVGGLSVIALRAERAGRSSIVARPETVTTPHTDVDVVVTDHGVADLRGADQVTRARRLAAVAAPEHREHLERCLGER